MAQLSHRSMLTLCLSSLRSIHTLLLSWNGTMRHNLRQTQERCERRKKKGGKKKPRTLQRAHRSPSRSSMLTMAPFSSLLAFHTLRLSCSTAQLPRALPVTMCSPLALLAKHVSGASVTCTCRHGCVMICWLPTHHSMCARAPQHSIQGASVARKGISSNRQKRAPPASSSGSSASQRTCSVGAWCLKCRSHTSSTPSWRAVKNTPGRVLLQHPPAVKFDFFVNFLPQQLAAQHKTQSSSLTVNLSSSGARDSNVTKALPSQDARLSSMCCGIAS